MYTGSSPLGKVALPSSVRGADAPAEFAPFVLSARLQGLRDCCRSLDWRPTVEGGGLMLVSACQDRLARIWLVTRDSSDSGGGGAQRAGGDALARLVKEAEERMRQADHLGRVERFALRDGSKWEAKLDALLVGHEVRSPLMFVCVDSCRLSAAICRIHSAPQTGLTSLHLQGWVQSCRWAPPAADREPAVLTTSLDRSMCLWMQDASTGVWTAEARFGSSIAEVAYCLYGGVWGPAGAFVLACGYNGALHMWRRQPQPEADADAEAAAGAQSPPSLCDAAWGAAATVGGHSAAVTDAAWSADGRYLLSVAKDQTTRLWSRWSLDGGWHEVARPQIHGHDIACAAYLGGARAHRFVSGGTYGSLL